MDKFDRMQQIHRIFSSRKTPISIADLSQRLECSEKTVYRAIQNLQDYVQAPLVKDDDGRGWLYDPKLRSDCNSSGRFELPGLWLTAEEINGLAIILELTREMESSLLSDDIGLVRSAVEKLLSTRNVSLEQFSSKVSYLPKRKLEPRNQMIQRVCSALVNSVQLDIEYVDYQGKETRRTLSPLKLVHYDENWYLDAWCHLREEFRSFLIARISKAMEKKKKVQNVSDEALHHHYASSYGIFAGQPKHLAKLSFTGNAAREAASYRWHPDQSAEWQGKTYLLNIPYNDDRELLRTLLGYGANVEILGPSALKKKLLRKAKEIVSTYDPNWGSGKF